MSETFNDFFLALLYGDGSWLGFLLILSIFMVLMISWKYGGVIDFFVAMLIGINYVEHGLGYHAVGMFAFVIFSLYYLAKTIK